MKHFSLEELVSAQERSLLDFSHPHVRRGKMKQLLTLIHGEKIKGIKTIIEEAK